MRNAPSTAMERRKVDINTATVEDFAELSGIGLTKAKAIVSLRNELGKFSEVGDMLKVPGIGQILMDQLRSSLKCRSSKASQRRKVPEETSKRRKVPEETSKRRKVPEEAPRTTSRTRNDKPLPLEEKPALRAGSTCDASFPVISCRRYYTRRCGLEIVSQGLPSDKKPKRRIRRRRKGTNAAAAAAEPSNPGSARQSPLAGQMPVEPVTFHPCSGRSDDGSLGLANAEDSSSKRTSASGSCEPAIPSCSRCSNIFLSAQNLEKRGLPHRTVLPNATAENCGHVLRQCAGRNGDGVEEDDGGSAENSLGERIVGLSQASDSLNSASTISSQSRLLMPHDVPETHMVKRKHDPVEGNRGPKKFCGSDDGSFSFSSESVYEQQTVSGVDLLPSSSLRKQKIPSKKNPPPLLIGWLKTFQDWTHAERLLALDELMEACDPTAVRHVMQVIEPQFQRDFISLLPKELALYVLSFLEPNDLLRAAQTCRYWHMLAEDNILWREKCHEEGISESLVFGNISRRKPRPPPRSPWKSLYLHQQQIEKNWRASNRSPKVLKGHDDHVITCLEFNGTKIVSGSDDNTLKVWSAITGKCLRTLTGHTGGVWSSQMSGNIIISGSTDRTLKVWDAETGRTIYTLYGHTSTVRCMHLHKNRVVSGSRDATLRMWDIETGHCLHVLIGHMAAVRCVQYDGRRVVSGAYDYMVKIWDPEKETCLQTLAGHTNRVYSLQFDGLHIVSGSLDTSIRVWSAETGSCLHTLVGHQSLTSGMELKDNILVSGNADSTVKVWNITTGQCLQTLNGPNKHQSAVTCLQFNRKLIITSSDDGTIKIWDLKTGEFVRNLVTLESGGSGGVVWRIRCNNSKLVCAVGSRNGTEETKLLVLDFDVDDESPSGGRVAVTSS